MVKKITSRKKVTKKLSKKVASMRLHAKIISVFAVLAVITVGVITIVNTTSVQGVKETDAIPLVSTAQAEVKNVRVATLGNAVNVQFDYDLVNGAEGAYVDAALSGRRSFNPTFVTGPGRYNETLTEVADGTYYILIVISGNPDYVLGDPGPGNKTLFITLPETEKTKNGDPFVRTIRNFFHHQHKKF
jgi:hypothetical protein